MHLVQLLLPLYDASGKRFGQPLYAAVARELTDRFGGMTAYSRAPATGLWEQKPGKTMHDDIVVCEVMVDAVDSAWWAEYRKELEERFQQKELVVRAHEIRRL
jgi:hypothetical protein